MSQRSQSHPPASNPSLGTIGPNETLIALSDLPKALARRGGRKPHVATGYRWASRGVLVQGQRRVLETTKIGGTRYTSKEALERFSAPGAPTTDSATDPSRESARRVAEAEQFCDREGLR